MIEIALFALLQIIDPAVQESEEDRRAYCSQPLVTCEPKLPDGLTTSTEIVCGDDVLLLSGYGNAFPRDTTPEIRFNNERLTRIWYFEEDLRGRPGGVFRIVGECSSWNDRIYVNITYAQTLMPEGMSYQAGSAVIENGKIIQYISLREVNMETFWRL